MPRVWQPVPFLSHHAVMHADCWNKHADILPAVKYLKTSMKIGYWKLFTVYLDLKSLLTLYLDYSVLTQKPKLILLVVMLL